MIKVRNIDKRIEISLGGGVDSLVRIYPSRQATKKLKSNALHKKQVFLNMQKKSVFDIDISRFDYILPNEMIAKYPLKNRDESKLLIYNKGEISQEKFKDIHHFLPKNSLVVFNNTKVISARLYFHNCNGAKIEIFCLEPSDDMDFAQSFSTVGNCRWNCLIGNQKRWKSGTITLNTNIGGEPFCIEAKLIKRLENYNVVEFQWFTTHTFGEILDNLGKIPIPPYLNRESEDCDKHTYQTVYGKIPGSVAAPTAGLHFTDGVLQSLKKKDIVISEVTLHVGAGTFKPLSSSTIHEHTMHSEFFTVSFEILKNLEQYLGNITAVGTTTVRTLESLYFIGCQLLNGLIPANNHFVIGQWEPYEKDFRYTPHEALSSILEYMKKNELTNIHASTSIMIIPGYQHKFTTRLITNFHQPKSTLLLLLASIVGDNWQQMYSYALKHNYRFLSYGDCCLVI